MKGRKEREKQREIKGERERERQRETEMFFTPDIPCANE